MRVLDRRFQFFLRGQTERLGPERVFRICGLLNKSNVKLDEMQEWPQNPQFMRNESGPTACGGTVEIGILSVHDNDARIVLL